VPVQWSLVRSKTMALAAPAHPNIIVNASPANPNLLFMINSLSLDNLKLKVRYRCRPSHCSTEYSLPRNVSNHLALSEPTKPTPCGLKSARKVDCQGAYTDKMSADI